MRMMPFGVQGTNLGLPMERSPAFSGWNPSTSFFGSMVSKTRCESICLGNGNSRKEFDLDELKKYGTVIGSNAIYRDFTPDILVALDSRMSHEIYRSGYCSNNISYFRDMCHILKCYRLSPRCLQLAPGCPWHLRLGAVRRVIDSAT